MEEAKKTKCYKRLIHKQFIQASGLCGQQFLSYLPKRFTHLCRALYGDAILVYRFGAPIWPLEIDENIWSSLFPWKLLLFTRKLAYVHINISSNTWNGYIILTLQFDYVTAKTIYCCRRHLWFYDRGRLGRVEIATLRIGARMTRTISFISFGVSTWCFREQKHSRARRLV